MRLLPSGHVACCYAVTMMLCMVVFSAFAGVFDCDNEVQVNTVFGNRAPLTESYAQRAGWTKMEDILSVFHSEWGIAKLAAKMAMYPGVAAAKLRVQLENMIDDSRWTSAQLQDVSDMLDSILSINHKYISPNGKHEAVYNPDTGKLVNQGIYVGTYNKHAPQNFMDNVQHVWTSIAPHIACVVFDDYVWEPTTQCFIVSETGQQIDVSCDNVKIVGDFANSVDMSSGQTTDSRLNLQQNSPVAISDAGISSCQSGIPAELAAMLGQVSGQIANVQSQRHYCTSFEFVKDYRGANREVYAKQYRCTECGKGTMVNVRDGETIEDEIAANRQRQTLTIKPTPPRNPLCKGWVLPPQVADIRPKSWSNSAGFSPNRAPVPPVCNWKPSKTRTATSNPT